MNKSGKALHEWSVLRKTDEGNNKYTVHRVVIRAVGKSKTE